MWNKGFSESHSPAVLLSIDLVIEIKFKKKKKTKKDTQPDRIMCTGGGNPKKQQRFEERKRKKTIESEIEKENICWFNFFLIRNLS